MPGVKFELDDIAFVLDQPLAVALGVNDEILSWIINEGLDFNSQDNNTNIQLTAYFGLSFISDMYEENYYGHVLKDRLEDVIRLMRFSTTQANNLITRKKFMDIFSHLDDILWRYSSEKRTITFEQDANQLELVKSCSIGNHIMDCGSRFSHTLTHQGICSVFQGQSLHERFTKDLFYTKYLEEAGYLINPMYNKALTFRDTRSYDLLLVLDTNEHAFFGLRETHFSISLGSKNDLMITGREVRPGHRVTIIFNVISHVVKTSSNRTEKIFNFRLRSIQFQSLSEKCPLKKGNAIYQLRTLGIAQISSKLTPSPSASMKKR